MTKIHTSRKGINYDVKILKDKTTVMTKAVMFGIHRSNGELELSLKIGRYNKFETKGSIKIPYSTLEMQTPKSELTLDNEEFLNLVDYFQENYQPFKEGLKSYISYEGNLTKQDAESIKKLFEHPEKNELVKFIISNEIISKELYSSLKNLNRIKAVEEFEMKLEDDLVEHDWQEWFTENAWVLGSEFVKILDERRIDTANITDFLMQAYDGFLDIIEIKRPEGNLNFWMSTLDHGNYVPSSDLIKAVTQASEYIYEVEREANSIKFLESVDNVKTIKPRCILIFGRSNGWNKDQVKTYRILNSGYHNLSILTYDHVLERAKRIVGIEDEEINQEKSHNDVPF